jgi:hypothetical protein
MFNVLYSLLVATAAAATALEGLLTVDGFNDPKWTAGFHQARAIVADMTLDEKVIISQSPNIYVDC